MTRCITHLALATILVAPAVCTAQVGSAPEIVLSHRGMAALIADTKTLFDLTSLQEQKS